MRELEQNIIAWRDEMKRAGVTRTELLDELEEHLRAETEKLKDEVGEDAAFRIAVSRLGDAKKLKQEFAKVNFLRLGILQGKPVGLYLLAAWFIWYGSRAAYILAHKASAWDLWNLSKRDGIWLGMLVLFSLQLLVGAGLLARWRVAKYSAFVFIAPEMLYLLTDIFAPLLWPNQDFHHGVPYLTNDIFQLGLVFWACSYLLHPSVRRLFQPFAKTKPSQ